MDIDINSENDHMNVIQAGDNEMDIDEVQGGDHGDNPMDIDEVQGGDHMSLGDMYSLDDAMDVDDIGDGQQMEGIEVGDANEDLMDVDDAY